MRACFCCLNYVLSITHVSFWLLLFLLRLCAKIWLRRINDSMHLWSYHMFFLIILISLTKRDWDACLIVFFKNSYFIPLNFYSIPFYSFSHPHLDHFVSSLFKHSLVQVINLIGSPPSFSVPPWASPVPLFWESLSVNLNLPHPSHPWPWAQKAKNSTAPFSFAPYPGGRWVA